MSPKNSLRVRSSVFWVRSLLPRFSVIVAFSFLFLLFFSREKAQVVTGHTPHCSLVLFSFPFLSPPHLVYHPFWPCVLFFSHFVGVPFWGPGVLAFFGFSQTRGGMGASCRFSFCRFCFSPFVVFAAFFTLLEGSSRRRTSRTPGHRTAPRPSEGPGSPIVRGRLDTAFRDSRFRFSAFGRGSQRP